MRWWVASVGTDLRLADEEHDDGDADDGKAERHHEHDVVLVRSLRQNHEGHERTE